MPHIIDRALIRCCRLSALASVRHVVTYKLDRLGRSLTHLAIMIGEFQTRNIGLICTSQGIDTSKPNPVAQLQLGVLMAVAEFEKGAHQRADDGGHCSCSNARKANRPATSFRAKDPSHLKEYSNNTEAPYGRSPERQQLRQARYLAYWHAHVGGLARNMVKCLKKDRLRTAQFPGIARRLPLAQRSTGWLIDAPCLSRQMTQTACQTFSAGPMSGGGQR